MTRGADPLTEQWTGQVAPLGVISEDSRMLDPAGQFPHRPLPLPVTWRRAGVAVDHVNAVAGQVEAVTTTRGGIAVAVTLDDEDAAEQVDSGQRMPALELADVEADMVDGVMVVRSGTVVGVSLTEIAAWPPDQVWLKREREQRP